MRLPPSRSTSSIPHTHRSPLKNSFSLLSALFLIALLSSCSSPTPAPTPTDLPATAIPLPATAQNTPEPTAAVTAVPAPARAQYTMNVVLDYAAKSVVVDETIVYPNHAAQPLTDLVLAVEPNFWLG